MAPMHAGVGAVAPPAPPERQKPAGAVSPPSTVPVQLLSRPSHTSVALVRVHAYSQPSVAMPFKSTKPAAQPRMRHTLVEQPVMALARGGHTVPHAPQLFGSRVRSKPSSTTPSQLSSA